HPQGGKARRPADRAGDEIPVRHQSADGENDRPHGASDATRPRRRGDRMMRETMHRRSFLTLLGASAAAWPMMARAQQDGRVRRVGVLIGGAENDREMQAGKAALLGALAKLGWIEGRNLRIDIRVGAGDAEIIRAHAAELAGLTPDVIVTTNGVTTRAA